MKTTQFTGLNPDNLQGVLNGLQQLLADYQVFYTNLRGFHWNVKGKNFYVLHEQFEKMYDNAAEKIDEIAERILMLDGIPAHNFSTYLKTTQVKETGYMTDGDACLNNIMETLKMFVASERNILKEAAEAGDEATVALMSDYIKEQEKSLWMLTAYNS
jgi:starvation-inducible DNA-binding protein